MLTQNDMIKIAYDDAISDLSNFDSQIAKSRKQLRKINAKRSVDVNSVLSRDSVFFMTSK